MFCFLMAGVSLFGALSSWLDLTFWVSALKAMLGLGFVIFVHELGHFLVAKACGVKCEKFYLGFDIYGLKLAKFQWGETEYGIGILPLGGYVKMLGQDDNPNQMAEEFERAKTPGGLDPRSYLAQSIPERMAIISAGVVMNLIFAVIFASIAYSLGVDYTPTIVGNVIPGDPAWMANLRPGDELVSVNGATKARFEHDLQYGSMLADTKLGLPLEVKRHGQEKIEPTTLIPRYRKDMGRMVIGMNSSQSLKVMLPADLSTYQNGLARATPPFQTGDVIVAVNGQATDTFAQFEAFGLKHAAEPLTLIVKREPPEDSKSSATSEVTITVPPQNFKTLGLVMEPGPIVAIQPSSPADQAGLQVGDLLVKVDGATLGDPLTLGERLRRRPGETVALVVERGTKREQVTLSAKLRAVDWIESPSSPRAPISVPALGIAYGVGTKVVSVEPGSPAEAAGITAGVSVISARVQIDPAVAKAQGYQKSNLDFDFVHEGDYRADWPFFALQGMQHPTDQLEVVLRTEGGSSYTLKPATWANTFEPDHGLAFYGARRTRVAETTSEAIALGARETYENALLVYMLLRRMSSGQVSATNLGGPGTIFAAASRSASQGLAPLLIFLTMLSANLAVINFLPIPLLDGGHIAMLTYEAIWHKPVSERFMIGLQYFGAAILMSLMLWVLGLDVFRFLIAPFLMIG